MSMLFFPAAAFAVQKSAIVLGTFDIQLRNSTTTFDIMLGS